MDQAWYIYPFGWVIALKGPRFSPLFSERYSKNVRVVPLFKGWRITIRRKP